MKTFRKIRKIAGFMLAVICIFYTLMGILYCIAFDKWMWVLKIFLFLAIGFALAKIKLFEAISWKWKKILKDDVS